MSDVTYTVTLQEANGCNVTSTDDLDHLGDWLMRTIVRLNASEPVACWQPRITYFGERRL